MLCGVLSAAPGVCPDRPVALHRLLRPAGRCLHSRWLYRPARRSTSTTTRGAPSCRWFGRQPRAAGHSRRVPHGRRLRDRACSRRSRRSGRCSTATARRPRRDFQRTTRAERNACKVKPEFGDVVLASFNGIEDVGQAGAGELAGPLAAQNGRYVRYQTLYNRAAFEFIVRNAITSARNLPKVPSPRPVTPVMEFPMGSCRDQGGMARHGGLSGRSGEAVLHAPGHGARSCDRSLRPGHGRTGGPAHHPEDAQPAAVDLVVLRADRQRAACRFGERGEVHLPRRQARSPMPAENPLSLTPLAKEPVQPFNVERPFFAKRASEDGADQLSIPGAVEGTRSGSITASW